MSKSKARKTELVKLAKKLIEEIRNNLQDMTGEWVQEIKIVGEGSHVTHIMLGQRLKVPAAQKLVKALNHEQSAKKSRETFWQIPSQAQSKS